MIRLFILVSALLLSCIYAQSGTDSKIEETSERIKSFDKQYLSLNKKMAETARAILIQKKAILKQQKHLEQLSDELKQKKEKYELDKKELEQLKVSQNNLSQKRLKIEKELISLMARSISLSLLANDENTITADSLITEEVFKQLTLQTQKKIKSLSSDFTYTDSRINDLKKRTLVLQKNIARIDAKQKRLRKEKKEKELALKKLNKDKKKYRRSVKNLLEQKDALKKELTRLNIIQEDEKERERSAKRRREQQLELNSKNLPKVKKVGTSYHKVRTRRYRGKKTIAPLEKYTVTKRYGPYVDPIYQIKIFNESVLLKPARSNAKVMTILNGKVIMAKNTPLLDNVVIVEHTGGLHTIYAHMDKIAPRIKKGKKIKKGTVIGRVSKELMFEVTQKNYHIDPLRLIR